MILEIRIENYRAYPNGVRLSMSAWKGMDGVSGAVYAENGYDVLKSVCLYGANNTGKSCFIKAVDAIRNVLLNIKTDLPANIFTDSNICSLGISFLEGGRVFSYDFGYDSTVISGFKRGFVYECLKELSVDEKGITSEKTLYLRDVDNGKYSFDGDERLNGSLDIFSASNILIYTVNGSMHPLIAEYKDILRNFASKIDVLNMKRVPLNKTISVLKYDRPYKDKVVELIKRSDLEIDDYRYLKNAEYGKTRVESNSKNGMPDVEDMVTEAISADDMLRLVSVHGGKVVQSLSFDSDGTQAMISLAGYIVDALQNGRMLVVDELDEGLHYKLTREIVSLFNDASNLSGQLIFTTHDVSLLDFSDLFREDQIWILARGDDVRVLSPLFDMPESESESSESDLASQYKKGGEDVQPAPDFSSITITDRKARDGEGSPNS